MKNFDKYQKAFCDSFNLTNDQLPGLKYQAISLWDSVGHMNLVANLEDAFDIMMETDDIIDLSSFEKGMEILKEKYNVNFDE